MLLHDVSVFWGTMTKPPQGHQDQEQRWPSSRGTGSEFPPMSASGHGVKRVFEPARSQGSQKITHPYVNVQPSTPSMAGGEVHFIPVDGHFGHAQL